MQRSGMLRKLDEVGRIVIPKEIRKYLKLKEGSKLEIGINNLGEVVLSNTDTNYTILEMFNLLLPAVHNVINKNILLVQDKEVIKSYGCDYVGKIVSASVMKLMQDNSTYIASVDDKTTILPMMQNVKITCNSQIIITLNNFAVVVVGEDLAIDLQLVKSLEFLLKLIGNICL